MSFVGLALEEDLGWASPELLLALLLGEDLDWKWAFDEFFELDQNPLFSGDGGRGVEEESSLRVDGRISSLGVDDRRVGVHQVQTLIAEAGEAGGVQHCWQHCGVRHGVPHRRLHV